MSRMTLSSFERDRVETKFESLQLELEFADSKVLTFRHLFRLPKSTRKEIAAIQDAKSAQEEIYAARAERVEARDKAVAERERLAAEGVDKSEWPEVPALEEGDQDEIDFQGENIAFFQDILRAVADDGPLCERFLEYVGEDMAYLAVIFAEWSKLTQPGEAESSES